MLNDRALRARILPFLVAFAFYSAIVLVLTTPYESPAKRLARYSRYTRRSGSPGVEAETAASAAREERTGSYTHLSPAMMRMLREFHNALAPITA